MKKRAPPATIEDESNDEQSSEEESDGGELDDEELNKEDAEARYERMKIDRELDMVSMIYFWQISVDPSTASMQAPASRTQYTHRRSSHRLQENCLQH